MCKNSFYLLSIFASKHLSITYNIIRRSVYTRKMCVFFFTFAEPIVLDIYIICVGYWLYCTTLLLIIEL